MMFPDEASARAWVASRLAVSRETMGRLDGFAASLARWNRAINLVAPHDLPRLWARHIADSAQLFEDAPPKARHWVDAGSGGGLPGMVLAILGAEIRPALRFTLIESKRRKAAFLRHVSRETGIRPEILSIRTENWRGAAPDIVSARALAPLPRLLQMIRPLFGEDTVLLAPKGASAQREWAALQGNGAFSCEIRPNLTNAAARILVIRKGRM